MMENFNFDKLNSSNEEPLKELIEQVQYDTFSAAYDCIEELGVDFLVSKGSKRPMQIVKGLIEYFQQPHLEEYEKCAVLLEAAKSYRRNKKELKKLKKTKE